VAPEPLGGELEPGERVDRHGVRGDELAHLADDQLGVAAVQQPAGALAEPGQIGAGERAADGKDDRGGLHEGSKEDRSVPKNSSVSGR